MSSVANKALELIGKELGMFKEQVEANLTGSLCYTIDGIAGAEWLRNREKSD